MDFTSQQFITFVQAVGFPIALVIWFMLRTEKVIERNTVALETLTRIESQELELLRTLTGKDLSKEFNGFGGHPHP